VTEQNDLCCFIGLTCTLSLKLSFYNYLCCFFRKCYCTVFLRLPHSMEAAAFLNSKLLFWVLMNVIWPMSVYIPNFTQISSLVTETWRKNINSEWYLPPFWILSKVGYWATVMLIWPISTSVPNLAHWRPRYGNKTQFSEF